MKYQKSYDKYVIESIVKVRQRVKRRQFYQSNRNYNKKRKSQKYTISEIFKKLNGVNCRNNRGKENQ